MTRKWTIMWAFVKVASLFWTRQTFHFHVKHFLTMETSIKHGYSEVEIYTRNFKVFIIKMDQISFDITLLNWETVSFLLLLIFLFYTRDWIKNTVWKLKVNITLTYILLTTGNNHLHLIFHQLIAPDKLSIQQSPFFSVQQ